MAQLQIPILILVVPIQVMVQQGIRRDRLLQLTVVHSSMQHPSEVETMVQGIHLGILQCQLVQTPCT